MTECMYLIPSVCVCVCVCSCFHENSGHFYDNTPTISGQLEELGHFGCPHFPTLLTHSQ